MKQVKIINNTILLSIPVIFLFIIGLKVFFLYSNIDNKMLNYVKKEATTLDNYFIANRLYYQKLFVNKTLKLDANTLQALPAFSAYPISHEFLSKNKLGVKIQTVSSRARNPKNQADKDEMEAIKIFKKDKTKKEYIKKTKEYYQYATPLYINNICLKCHGKKQNAPKLIQERYDKSYNYKLGDLRGIVSIKIPVKNVETLIYKDFKTSLLYDLVLFLILFSLIYYLVLKSKKINTELNDEIEAKTLQLKQQNNYLQSYIKALDTSLALVRTDANGNILYANEKFLKDTGYTLDEVVGQNPRVIKHPTTSPAVVKKLWSTILEKKIWSGVLKGLTKSKDLFVSKVYIIPILDEKGDIKEFIAPRVDITDIVKSKEKLRDMLITDSLTKLPNRTKLIDDLQKASKLKNKHLALLNIDSFKDINDIYGHRFGDKVLIFVAQQLLEYTKDKEFSLYKMPSDEYAIFTTKHIDSKDFISFISTTLHNIEHLKAIFDDTKITISFSCGIASNENDIIVKTDMALKKAKKENKQLVIYDDSINTAMLVTQNIYRLNILKEAIKSNNIVPYFQPIYNINKNKIDKYECLARIITKDKDILAPYHFLDIAKKSKLYDNITRSMITKSFEYFKDKDYEFSVNISNEDILNIEIKQLILDSLKNFSHPSNVVFEILESERIDNYEKIREFIISVKNLGAKVAIDDFGSGYSNFSHLLELDVNYLKIDSSLVRYVKSDPNSKQIVNTIITFAKQLNLKTIAEFVEDKESLDILKDMQCDYIQGYYIGKPENTIL